MFVFGVTATALLLRLGRTHTANKARETPDGCGSRTLALILRRRRHHRGGNDDGMAIAAFRAGKMLVLDGFFGGEVSRERLEPPL